MSHTAQAQKYFHATTYNLYMPSHIITYGIITTYMNKMQDICTYNILFLHFEN